MHVCCHLVSLSFLAECIHVYGGVVVITGMCPVSLCYTYNKPDALLVTVVAVLLQKIQGFLEISLSPCCSVVGTGVYTLRVLILRVGGVGYL